MTIGRAILPKKRRRKIASNISLARTVLAVMGRSFTNFGLGEHTLRLFQARVEKLGCSLKVQKLDRVTPEEIRDALGQVVTQYLRGEPA